jgi:hypothetical protein
VMQNQPPGNLVPPRRALLPRTIFMTVVIPNARGFCGVRDLLFPLSYRRRLAGLFSLPILYSLLSTHRRPAASPQVYFALEGVKWRVKENRRRFTRAL